jgi:purine-nucleoside phosphorylase
LAQHIQAYAAASGNLPAAFTDPITPTPSLLHVAAKAASTPTSALHRGALISANSVVAASSQKKHLGQLSNALAVDMEAHSIGRVAIQQQLPFVSLKTVFDAYDDDISLHLTQCTRPTGTLKLASLASAILCHPALIAHLLRLRRKAKTAGQNLENWLSRFLTLMSHES